MIQVIGWKLFLHSVRMVQRNIPQLMRIFLIPSLVVIGIAYLVMWDLFDGSALQYPISDSDVVSGFIWRVFALWLVAGVVAGWTVVVWHRYVLLEERPDGWVPTFHMTEVIQYLLRLLQLVVIGAAIYAMVLFVAAVVFSAAGNFAIFLIIAAAALIAVSIYRLALILPAAAVGKPIGLGESLQFTEGAFGALFVLSACLVGLQLTAELVFWLLADAVVIVMILNVVFALFVAILNISVLTTLYGYYVEKRAI
ncbi:hypothetical protein [Phaeobacter sp. C3_T13_0]|uniref:hypothetical protein n=1 Tax=Phaeobacter cretensis TaxID=3342641 RepID=UPI0039BD28B8